MTTTWLNDMLGYRRVAAELLPPVARRGTLRVKGAGGATVALVDDPVAAESVLTVTAGSGGGSSAPVGIGFRFTYAGSGATGDSDPGAGLFRANNAALASATQLYVDVAEFAGTDITDWLDQLDDYVGAVKGILRLESLSDDTKWIEYTVTGWTTATGYRKLTVAYKDGPGGLTTTAGDTFLSFDFLGVASNLNNQSITGARVISYAAEVNNGDSGGADTIDWTAGQAQRSRLTANCTYSFTAPPANTTLQLRLVQDNVGGRTVTWPGSVTWLSGTAPTLASGVDAVTIVGFWFDGTTYWGAAAGGSGVTAGNGLTGTSTLAVLAEDASIVVGASGVRVASQLPARGAENVIVDLYPSTQQQGTVANAASVNIDVPIAAGKRYTITASVWVDDGAGGACLYSKDLLVKAHQTGGAAVEIDEVTLSAPLEAAGFTFTGAPNGTNYRFTLSNTSGSTRSYNVAIGFWSMDKP